MISLPISRSISYRFLLFCSEIHSLVRSQRKNIFVDFFFFQEVDRIPRSIQCKLTEDLVGQCFVGQTVAFTGIIKVGMVPFFMSVMNKFFSNKFILLWSASSRQKTRRKKDIGRRKKTTSFPITFRLFLFTINEKRVRSTTC